VRINDVFCEVPPCSFVENMQNNIYISGMRSLERYLHENLVFFIVKVEVESMQKYHHEDGVDRFVRNVGVYATQFT